MVLPAQEGVTLDPVAPTMELSWTTVAVFVAIGGYLLWVVTHFQRRRQLRELPLLSDDDPTLSRVRSLISDQTEYDMFVTYAEEQDALREISSFSEDRMQRAVHRFRAAIERGWQPGDTRKAHEKVQFPGGDGTH